LKGFGSLVTADIGAYRSIRQSGLKPGFHRAVHEGPWTGHWPPRPAWNDPLQEWGL